MPLSQVETITSDILRSLPRLGWPLCVCVTNDHEYVPLDVNTSRSVPRSWLVTEFVTRLTRQVSLAEQELLTLPEHLSSPPIFSGVRVIRSLALYVCYVDRCLSFVLFFWPLCCIFFDIRILIAPLVSSSSSWNSYRLYENTQLTRVHCWNIFTMKKNQTHPSGINKINKKKVFTLINSTLLLSLHEYKYFSDMTMQLDICKIFNGSGHHDQTEMINLIEQIWKEYMRIQ